MEKPYWEGKEYSYFSHKKCEFFPCHKNADPDDLTVCSVIARYMPWVRNAVGISGIRKRELKTAQTVCFRISEKTMDMSQENTRNC